MDDLHYATRAPKYEVLAVIIGHARADLERIERELRERQVPAEE